MLPSFTPAELVALEHVDQLTDRELVDELILHDDVVRHGYGNPDELRELAALSLTLARRIDRRSIPPLGSGA